MKKFMFALVILVTVVVSTRPLSGCTGVDWAEPVIEKINTGGNGSEKTDQSKDQEEENNDSPEIKKEDISLSFIIMGDVHYCEERFYDLDAMETDKPSDYRQITQTYAPVAAANWKDQIATVVTKAKKTKPEVKCVVQLGDISEGLGNFAGAPSSMAKNAMEVMGNAELPCPWVVVKGNHDITGVGDACKQEAKTAFDEYYVPFIKSQTGVKDVTDGAYSYETDGVLFVVLDAYSSADQTEFAKKALEGSTAKYKFVCIHEPVIPATERCWHYLRSKSVSVRDAFLKVIAENQAYVLCGHLHRYSVLRRNTEWGPIVQVMATSVTNVKRTSSTSNTLDGVEYYGTYLCDTYKPDYSPTNHATRHAQLEAEAPFVDYYKMNTLAGYGVISINGKKDKVTLEYYPAFETDTPYDTVDLTELYNQK